MAYNESKAPRTVGATLSGETHAYFLKLFELGVLEGPVGDMQVNPSLRSVVSALHTVLAGGEVEVRTLKAGDPDIVRDLDRRLDNGTRESNDINGKARFQFVMSP